jgi:transposase
MNLLKVNEQQAILALDARGWSQRRIARELGLHRETVGRYLRLAGAKSAISTAGSGAAADSKPAIPTLGADGPSDSNPAISTAGSAAELEANPAIISTPGFHAGRRSLCESLREPIEVGLHNGLSAQRIFQDLVGEHGFSGSYESVKRFARQLGLTVDPPFRRMECRPGEELQIDFGQGAWIEVDGKRRRPHLLRAVLSHSRKGYSEAVWRQDTETFLRCMENAFRHFGGVTQTVVIDNLKAGVLAADWYDPELNPKLREFAVHYGTTILPTKPAMPRHKGKIESGVKYGQNNALKGRGFGSLAEQNRFLSEWERTVADTRIHGTVRQQVGKLFEASERPALLPLPASIFPCFTEVQRTVHRDGHVEYQKAYYSVPPEYVGRQVWLRADARVVRLFNTRMEPIGFHVRVEAGRFATADEHIHAHKRHPVERGAEYLLQRCRLLGTSAGAWAEAMLQNRGPYHLRVLQGLLQLARAHPGDRIERAAGLALHRGAFRLQDLRRLIEHDETVVQIDFLQTHPLIRDLSAYRLEAFSAP